jgi:hypothetical protein
LVPPALDLDQWAAHLAPAVDFHFPLLLRDACFGPACRSASQSQFLFQRPWLRIGQILCVGQARLGGVSLCRFCSPRCLGAGFVVFSWGKISAPVSAQVSCRRSRLLDSGHAFSFGRAESRSDFTLKLLRFWFVAGTRPSVLALLARSGFSAADFSVLWSAGSVLARQIWFSAPPGFSVSTRHFMPRQGALSVFGSEISRVKCSFCLLA